MISNILTKYFNTKLLKKSKLRKFKLINNYRIFTIDFLYENTLWTTVLQCNKYWVCDNLGPVPKI